MEKSLENAVGMWWRAVLVCERDKREICGGAFLLSTQTCMQSDCDLAQVLCVSMLNTGNATVQTGASNAPDDLNSVRRSVKRWSRRAPDGPMARPNARVRSI